MRKKAMTQGRAATATVAVSQVTASGIVYDTTSILGSEAAKRHIDTLRQAKDASSNGDSVVTSRESEREQTTR